MAAEDPHRSDPTPLFVTEAGSEIPNVWVAIATIGIAGTAITGVGFDNLPDWATSTSTSTTVPSLPKIQKEPTSTIPSGTFNLNTL
jgi:hypothetical protein